MKSVTIKVGDYDLETIKKIFKKTKNIYKIVWGCAKGTVKAASLGGPGGRKKYQNFKKQKKIGI